jgi:hypothetical protein
MRYSTSSSTRSRKLAATSVALSILFSALVSGQAQATQSPTVPGPKGGSDQRVAKPTKRCAARKRMNKRARARHCTRTRPSPNRRASESPKRLSFTIFPWTPQYDECSTVQEANWGYWYACSFFLLQSGVGFGDGAASGTTWYYLTVNGNWVPYWQAWPGYYGPAVNA